MCVCVTCGLLGVVAHEAEPTSLLLAVAKQVEETHLLQLSLEAIQVLKTEAKTNIWQPFLRFLNFKCIVWLKNTNKIIKGETPKCIRPNNDNTFSLTARKATGFFSFSLVFPSIASICSLKEIRQVRVCIFCWQCLLLLFIYTVYLRGSRAVQSSRYADSENQAQWGVPDRRTVNGWRFICTIGAAPLRY